MWNWRNEIIDNYVDFQSMVGSDLATDNTNRFW